MTRVKDRVLCITLLVTLFLFLAITLSLAQPQAQGEASFRALHVETAAA